MTLQTEYSYRGEATMTGDDTYHWEGLPPEILGGVRDYIARNLKVSATHQFDGFHISVTLEDVVIHQEQVSLALKT